MDGAELPTGAHHGENIQGGAQKERCSTFYPRSVFQHIVTFLHLKIHSLNSQTEAQFLFLRSIPES